MAKTLAELKAAQAAKKAKAASAAAPDVAVVDAVDPEVQAIMEASMTDDEKNAAAAASQKDEPGDTLTITNEHIEQIVAEKDRLQAENAELRAQIAEYEAKHGRAAEGLKAVNEAFGVVNTGSVQMAGHLPQDVSLIPTVDQINAAGQ